MWQEQHFSLRRPHRELFLQLLCQHRPNSSAQRCRSRSSSLIPLHLLLFVFLSPPPLPVHALPSQTYSPPFRAPYLLRSVAAVTAVPPLSSKVDWQPVYHLTKPKCHTNSDQNSSGSFLTTKNHYNARSHILLELYHHCQHATHPQLRLEEESKSSDALGRDGLALQNGNGIFRPDLLLFQNHEQ